MAEELDRALDCRRTEVTASKAGRLRDEETFVRSAARLVYKEAILGR